MAAAKQIVSEIFPTEERTKLAALRRDDPKESLVSRWKTIREARPDIAERRLGYVPLVIEHSWAVIALPEEGFAYTIGLNYHFQQPEILIAAPSLEIQDLKRLLNVIGQYVASRAGADDPGPVIYAGEPVDLTDFDISLTFQPYSEIVFQKYATGYLASFERFFEDREHESGDTLPVLWAELVSRKPAKKPAAKKPVAKTPAAKKPVAKTPAAKKPVAKKPAAKKAVAKKPAAKKPAAKKHAAKKPAAKKHAAKKVAPRRAGPR